MEKLSTLLKRTREEKGLTYNDIYIATKIHPKILQAIEEENFSIQSPVYMKSFLKEYLEFLGLSYDAYKRQINEIFDRIEKKFQLEINKSPFSLQPKLNKIRNAYHQLNRIIYLVYFTLFLGILMIVYYSFFHTVRNNNILQETTIKPDTIFIGPNKTQLIQPRIAQTDSISLEVKSIDTVWINIIIDNKFSDKVVLLPGDKKEWRAINFFRITVGNAGGIIITRNGKDIPPLGPRGTVVKSVIITRDTVIIGSKSKSRVPNSAEKYKIDSLSKIVKPTNPSKITPTLRDTKHLVPRR